MEIWARYNNGDWEHIDTVDWQNWDVQILLGEYKMAFGSGWEFEVRE